MNKYIAALLTVVLLMSLTAGCGSSGSKEESAGTAGTETDAAQSSTADASAGSEAEAEKAPEAEAFNIYSIGEDFKNRVQDFYPGYEPTGDNSGLISGVPIVWHVYTDTSEYRDVPDDKIDLFVVEEAFLRDYVESACSLDVVDEVGLPQESLSDQFLYTQQMATDADGKLKAVSWQATPGVFAYRRSIAREVLGTDDPEKVQEAVSDWETFADTAETVKDAGYYMLSGYEDAYRVYADNVTSAWVENGALNIDPHLEEWAVQTREFAENRYTHGTEQWSDEWRADHTGDGEVFGFFYSSWGIHYTLQFKAEGVRPEGVRLGGIHAVCRGPEPSHYGGQWIVAARGCGNTELARSIMKTLTCDPDVMKKITKDIREFTNTVSGMTELAQSDYKAEVLGGQNPIPVYVESAKLLSKLHTTTYDDDLDTGFQVTMQDYFAGKVSEIDALETFRKVALSRYEELLDIAGDEEEEQ